MSDSEQRRQESNAFLDRQYDASQIERDRIARRDGFYGALFDKNMQRIDWNLGITGPSVELGDDIHMIHDTELEHKDRELDALPEPDLRGRIIAERDYILRCLERSAVISITLKEEWRQVLRLLLRDQARSGLLDFRFRTEVILDRLDRLRITIEDEHRTAKMRAAEGAGLWTSISQKQMSVDCDFNPIEWSLSEVVDLLGRYRSRFGQF